MILLLVFCVLFTVLIDAAPTRNYSVPDPTNGTCAYDGLSMGDPFDETAYYQCCQHMWFFKYCLEGFVFDKYKLECFPINPTPTSPTLMKRLLSSTLCTPGDKQGNPFDDSKFDECVDGTHWETMSCSSGFRFDSATKQCQNVPTAACVLGEKLGMPNGDSYLYCDGNGWEIQECAPGTIYKESLKDCTPE
ncbi:hypothetical protein CAEBREN_24540 [Caenorhabditis brenneri]|uniref:Chitin-binding type-2 domain-containing protein n=1 Tax=Caenorhabditis brenneri TaxID=135651 RepID=G0P6D7_CAEBE|nr:hypothetical protein CAEBREN_24540 [Caenorhabditis brenneri]